MSQNGWNKDKIKKCMLDQKTYKELQPVLTEITNKNQRVCQMAVQAIKQQLREGSTADRLCAVRFAKDCFELAYPPFMDEIVNGIAPEMLQIITKLEQRNESKTDVQGVMKRIHITNSDSDLHSFCVECLKNWSVWLDQVEHKPNLNEISRNIKHKNTPQKFFIFTNKKSFLEMYWKNTGKKPRVSNDLKKQIGKILKQVEQLSKNGDSPNTTATIHRLQQQLDSAMDQYCTQTANFDQKYMNSCYQIFENFKRQAISHRKIDDDVAKGLPEKAFFKQDTEEDQEPQELRKSPKMKQRNLNIIAEEENESEVSNLKSPPNELLMLQHKKQQLEQQNKKIQAELEQLRNHHALSIQNSLTQQLMELRRKKFQKSQQLLMLQQQIIKKVYYQPNINDSPVRILSAAQPTATIPLNRHPFDKLTESVLQRPNIIQLKKCILKSNGCLYQDKSMLISVQMRQEVNKGQDTIEMYVTYQMQQKYNRTQFKIFSDMDIWAHDVQLKRQDKITYGQHLTIRRVDTTSLAIMKIRTKQLILPILFFNFLRHGEVSAAAFEAVLKKANIKAIEANGLKLDSDVCKNAAEVKKYFEEADIMTMREYERVRCVFILPSTEQLVFVQMKIYRGHTVSISCMEIVEKGKKCRLAEKLLRDLSFLFAMS